MSFFSWCQIVRFIMLVPNCPGAKLSGAKLSVFIMLVPNCLGAILILVSKTNRALCR